MRESDPLVIDETGDFAVVWKPPRMHCAPLQGGSGGTLLEWYAARFSAVLDLAGRKAGEGGLLHRLDYETRGLVLFAKNQRALEFLLATQSEGGFVKEYAACCVKAPHLLPGFPPPPAVPDFAAADFPPTESAPLLIKSFFRPFGPARKQVRPVTGESSQNRTIARDRGGYYQTEICGASGPPFRFTLRIRRGFRHQIRCHLSWLGYPIVNDPLYGTGEKADGGFLGLCSRRLFFPDPRTGEVREYNG
ncbi:MAG: RNA pseudouridine synthase [Spirochaetaceae bacterium]|nr:RNA pseudouridine synthase [Spirochaetaceae bacterium]